MANAAAAVQGLSVEELREGLQKHFRENGALRTLKTQLRTMVLSDVTRNSPKEAWAPPATGSSDSSDSDQSVGKVADLLIASHLKSLRPYSFSVFASEADLPEGLTTRHDSELLQLLALPPTSDNRTPLTQLVRHSLESRDDRRLQRANARSSGVQTDSDLTTTLEQRLALVDSQYALKWNTLRADSQQRSDLLVKKQVSDFEQQLVKESRAELERWKSSELIQMRQEEEARYLQRLADKEREWANREAALEHRAQLEQRRLEDLRRSLLQQEELLSRREKEMSQEHKGIVQSMEDSQSQAAALREKIRHLNATVTHYQDLAEERLHELERLQIRETRRRDEIMALRAEHQHELALRDGELAALRLHTHPLASVRELDRSLQVQQSAALTEQNLAAGFPSAANSQPNPRRDVQPLGYQPPTSASASSYQAPPPALGLDYLGYNAYSELPPLGYPAAQPQPQPQLQPQFQQPPQPLLSMPSQLSAQPSTRYGAGAIPDRQDIGLPPSGPVLSLDSPVRPSPQQTRLKTQGAPLPAAVPTPVPVAAVKETADTGNAASGNMVRAELNPIQGEAIVRPRPTEVEAAQWHHRYTSASDSIDSVVRQSTDGQDLPVASVELAAPIKAADAAVTNNSAAVEAHSKLQQDQRTTLESQEQTARNGLTLEEGQARGTLATNHSEGKARAEKAALEMVKLRDLQKRETENRNELIASEGSERGSLQWSEQQGRKRAKAAEEAEAARRKEAASYSPPARKGGPIGLSRDSDSDSSYKSSDGPAILRRSSSSDYD
jgi:hypothetical protein